MSGLFGLNIEAELNAKLQHDTLSAGEIIEGIQESFILAYRTMTLRAQPDRTIDELDATASQQIQEVFRYKQLTPQNATRPLFREVAEILEARFNLTSDPGLAEKNDTIINELVRKLPVVSPML